MELITSFLALVAAALSGFAGHVFAHDFCERSPRLAKSLIAKAITILPALDRERYSEEWLAHLNECEGVIEKFKHAFGCLLCAYSIRRIRIDEKMAFPKAVQFEIRGYGAMEMDIATGMHAMAVMATALQEFRSKDRPLDKEELGAICERINDQLGPLGDDGVKKFEELADLFGRTIGAGDCQFRCLLDGKAVNLSAFHIEKFSVD